MFKKNDNEKSDSKLKEIQKKISEFENENKNLLHKINDFKQNLEFNYELLSKIFVSNNGNKKLINDEINKGKSLFQNYDNILQKKKELNKKIYILKKSIEDNTFKNFKEINSYSIENEQLSMENNSKDKEIKKLKEELQKWRTKAFFKKPSHETIVSAPTNNNLEKLMEFIDIDNIMNNLMIISDEKEDKIKELKNQHSKLYEDMVKEAKKKEITINNLKDYDLEEEEIEDEESSDEEEDESNYKKGQEKKIIKELQKEYNDLENEYKKYENKINVYKKKYFMIKGKMDILKKSFTLKDYNYK